MKNFRQFAELGAFELGNIQFCLRFIEMNDIDVIVVGIHFETSVTFATDPCFPSLRESGHQIGST